MALWQFDLQIVPRSRIEEQGIKLEGPLPDAFAESEEWWKGQSLPAGYAQRFSALLPWATPWSANWEVYGDEESTRLDVLWSGPFVETLRLRLDARSLDPTLLEEITTLAVEYDWVFITPEHRVLAPDPYELWVELELSPAGRFVQNPVAFLNGFRKRGAG